MNDWRCAHCGLECGANQGHALGDPLTFSCFEGRMNERAIKSGLPLQFDFGRNVSRLNLCHVCRVPLPCGNDHVAIGGSL